MSPIKEPYNDKYSQPGPLQPEEKPKPVPKMYNQLDEKDLKSWWEKIREAEQKRDTELVEKYNQAINYFKSKQFPEMSDGKVVVNYIISTFRIILNTVYANQPDYKCEARNPAGELTKDIAELGLNYYTREIEVEDENRMVFLDSLLAGEGISLEGHSSQFIYATKPLKETDIPKSEEGEKKEGESGESQRNERPDEFEYAEYLKKSTPISFRISPKDFIRDITAKSLKKARWCGRRISKKPIDEILDNKLYRSEGLTKLEANIGSGDGKTADIYELQVKRRINGEITLWRLVLCEQVSDEYLYFEREEYKGEGFNYLIIQPNKLGDDVFAVSEFELYKGTQDQLNQIHSKIWEQISKSLIQTIINEDALTKKGKTALKKGEGIITAKTGMMDVRSAIAQAETSRVHPDLYRYEAITRDIFRIISGIGETARATAQPGAKTLGENQLIQSGTNLTLSGFGKKVRTFLIEQGCKRLQIIRQFSTEEQLIPIKGDIKVPQELREGSFIKFSSKIIKGEFGIALDLDTMKKQNEEIERAQFERMIDRLIALDPMMRNEGHRIKYTLLAKEWLRKNDKYNPDAYIEDMNLRTADEENLGFLLMSKSGQAIPVMAQEGEDYEEHLRKHMEFGESPLLADLNSQIKMIYTRHLAETRQRVEAERAQKAKVFGVRQR